MKSHQLTLSSLGLQNLVINSNNDEDEFRFIFGDHEIKMHKVYAEFISPIVSKLHQVDPTINLIEIDELKSIKKNSKLNKKEEFFNDEIDSLFQRISKGLPIKLNRNQSFKMQILSVLVGNEELFAKINDVFPIKISESNLNEYLKNIEFIFNLTEKSQIFDYESIVDFLASHFYSIDESEILKIPSKILFLIISNDHLKIESEDSLFELIQKISTKIGNDEIDIVSFYEQIDFSSLSEAKFADFLKEFDFNNLTNSLWRNLNRCFYFNFNSKSPTLNSDRYLYSGQLFEYDGSEVNCFKGIIHHLTKKSGGNVNDKGTVIVTASSTFNNRHPRYAVDLQDCGRYFQSAAIQNSWLKYDFGDMKVRPISYSIRTRHDCGPGGYHPSNWVIEGSNTGKDNDWKLIDERKNEKCLDSQNAAKNFTVNQKLEKTEFFRFLRLRQTGFNTGNNYTLPLSALEYFGYLKS